MSATETDAGMPGRDALDWAAAAFAAHATRAGLVCADAPRLVADAFDGRRGEAVSELEPRDLPSLRRGLSIGRHSVVLGLLPETVDDRRLSESIRRHRNQCVVARSTLAPNAVLDITLALIGPRGSEGKDVWRAAALAIERDDRVARKLVWLRPDDPAADVESFAAFASRTFLARPWATTARFSVAALDDIAADFDGSGAPRDTAGRWIRLAVERGGEPDSLVEGLVEVWKGRSAT